MSEVENRNWDYISHAIRDVFDHPTNSVIVYGDNLELIETLRKPEHGVETWGLYSQGEHHLSKYDFISPWIIDLNGCHFKKDFCQLLISFDYDITLKYGSIFDVAVKLNRLVRAGGHIMLVNAGDWTNGLDAFFDFDFERTKELKSYTMFRNDNVKVWKK